MTTTTIVPIETRVLQIVAEQVGVPLDKVTRASRLIADLSVDDLDLTEVAFQLEDEFEIMLLDYDTLDACTTAGDLVDVVTRALAEKAS